MFQSLPPHFHLQLRVTSVGELEPGKLCCLRLAHRTVVSVLFLLQGKYVKGANQSAVKLTTKRQARQYMNRRGEYPPSFWHRSFHHSAGRIRTESIVYAEEDQGSTKLLMEGIGDASFSAYKLLEDRCPCSVVWVVMWASRASCSAYGVAVRVSCRGIQSAIAGRSE